MIIARLLPILGITFIDILGFSILIPLMPYFIKHFGARDAAVGGLFATFALCQFIAGPVWGNVSDRVGRKRVLIISQIGATAGWTMLAFAGSLTTVFIARIIEGLSGGNLSVTQAYVADLVEPEKRSTAFGYIGASFSAGLVLGPLAGGMLFDRYGFSAPFLAAAALQIVTLIVTIVALPESRGAAPGRETASLREIVAALREPGVAPVLRQKLAYSLGLYAWFAVFALVLQAQLGLGPSGTSYCFAAFGLVSVTVQLAVVGRVARAVGDRATSLIGFACCVVSFGIAPFAHSLLALAPMLITFSFGLSLTNASLPALLTAASPENTRGTVLGVASSLESLSGVLTPPISTTLLGAYGVGSAAAFSGVFTSVALTLGLLNARASTRKQIHDDEHHRDHQQQVDEAAGDMERKPKHPEHEEYDDDSPE